MSRYGNVHKGGRPKGALAKHTLEAQAVKTLYVDLAKEHAKPVAEALLKKAVTGDIGAIKEFNDETAFIAAITFETSFC